MDDFALLAAKAAALRTKQAGVADRVGDLGEKATELGAGAAAVGYGAPRLADEYLAGRFKHPAIGGAVGRGKQLLNSALGRTTVPTGVDVATMVRRNAGTFGKTGRGGVMAAAAGLPLWALGRAFGGKPPEVAQAPPPPAPSPEAPPVQPSEAPDPTEGMTARQINNKNFAGRAKAALGSWWSRMDAQYGRGGGR